MSTPTAAPRPGPGPGPGEPSVAYALLERVLAAFSSGDAALLEGVLSPDLVEHQYGAAGSGAEAIANLGRAVQAAHRAVPDLTYTVEDHVEVGDRLWARLRAHGTNTGPYFGDPSGRPVELTVIDVIRVEDGRIAEHWGVPDRFAMMAQTGVLDRLT
jgi:predicted ester cyclase